MTSGIGHKQMLFLCYESPYGSSVFLFHQRTYYILNNCASCLHCVSPFCFGLAWISKTHYRGVCLELKDLVIFLNYTHTMLDLVKNFWHFYFHDGHTVLPFKNDSPMRARVRGEALFNWFRLWKIWREIVPIFDCQTSMKDRQFDNQLHRTGTQNCLLDC